MLQQFHDHRAAFEALRDGMCAAALRWQAAYPRDPRGPAYLIPASQQEGPWMGGEEKARLRGLLRETGGAYAVVEDIEPSCVLNVGWWSRAVGGGYVMTKAFLYGDHWRRKPLAQTSNGTRPWAPGRPKGLDAIVFRGRINGEWSIVYYRTKGADY
jgi:hypothetical protein